MCHPTSFSPSSPISSFYQRPTARPFSKMSKSFLISLFACSGLVLGLAPPTSNPSLLSPTYVESKYSLPQFDPNPSQRRDEVASNHAGFLYGPPLIGNSSFFPAGTLGGQRVNADVVAFTQNAVFITQSIEAERSAVVQKVTQVLYIFVQRRTLNQLIVERLGVFKIYPAMSFSTKMNGNSLTPSASRPATSPITARIFTSRWRDFL